MNDYTIVYKHLDLPEEDLRAYLTDAVRSEKMLAITDGMDMPGTVYRGRRTTEPEPEHAEVEFSLKVLA